MSLTLDTAKGHLRTLICVALFTAWDLRGLAAKPLKTRMAIYQELPLPSHAQSHVMIREPIMGLPQPGYKLRRAGRYVPVLTHTLYIVGVFSGVPRSLFSLLPSLVEESLGHPSSLALLQQCQIPALLNVCVTLKFKLKRG